MPMITDPTPAYERRQQLLAKRRRKARRWDAIGAAVVSLLVLIGIAMTIAIAVGVFAAAVLLVRAAFG